jgi:hypothetical protein
MAKKIIEKGQPLSRLTLKSIKEELDKVKMDYQKTISKQDIVLESIKGNVQTHTNSIDLLKNKFLQKLDTVEINFRNLSEMESLKSKNKELEVKISELIKDGKRQIRWRYFRLIFIAVGILTILVVFTSIFSPNNYRDNINGIDASAIKKIKQSDSIFINGVKAEINNEIYQYDTLKKITPGDEVALNKILIENFKKRNDNYIKEIEKEKNQLIKNVTIINLIGRYVIIICCIIAFVLVLQAFAGSKSRDDIFE